MVIRSGGNVRIAGRPGTVRNAADLPAGDITVLAVDLIGTTIGPKDLKKLSALSELRELLLPGPSFNPGSGSRLDANLRSTDISDEGLAAIGSMSGLEAPDLSATGVMIDRCRDNL